MSKENETTKSLKERSVAYPSVTLGDAIDFTTKLREALGKGPYSRNEAAKALGHAKLSGPAARKVAALVHYGLLVRSGNAYNQTQLAQDIIMPLSDEQKNEAVVKAVRSPRLFEKLIQKYGGQALPTMLQNVLVREGVSESAANEVVRIFTESIKHAGLLVNGVVSTVPVFSEEVSEEEETSAPMPVSSGINPQRVATPRPFVANNDEFVFDFKGGIKLIIPKNTSTSEAIADGELKSARVALSEFATKYMQSEGEESTVDVN